MNDVIHIARRLRERGRVASHCGDKSTANILYRMADRFERPIANSQEAIAKAQELGARLPYEPWTPGGAA